MKNNNYIIISTEFPPYDGTNSKLGGIGTWMYELAKNMSEMGTSVSVLATNKTTDDISYDEKQPFRIVRMTRKGWTNFKDITIAFHLLKLFVMGRYNCVLVSTIKLAAAPLLLSKLLNMKVISFAHGRDVSKVMSRRERSRKKKLLSKVHKVIVNSAFLKMKVQSFGIDESRIVVSNPCVDISKFDVSFDLEQFRDKLCLRNKIVLLTVARICENKGQDVVIRSLPKVISKIPNIVYLIVGEGSYRHELEKVAVEIGVKDNVIFTGAKYWDYNLTGELDLIDNVVPYFMISDIFIMVSRGSKPGVNEEAFGISYIEASACKKPIIAGKTGGVADAVEEGVTGVFVDSMSEHEISQAIIELASDRDLREKLGNNGYQRVHEKFNYRKTVSLLTRLISNYV